MGEDMLSTSGLGKRFALFMLACFVLFIFGDVLFGLVCSSEPNIFLMGEHMPRRESLHL